MNLSVRLKTIASFVDEGNILADIGTDHGYIPIYLVKNNVIPKALAMDISSGSLKKAEKNIKKHNLEEKINTRLSDGLSNLGPGEVDTIIITGMGGSLIKKILSDHLKVMESAKELILSPQKEMSLIREFLVENNFNITKEAMLKEGDKYYVVIKATKGNLNYSKEIYLKYGRFLLENKNPVLYEYLLEKKIKIEKIVNAMADKKKATTLTKELNSINEALDYYLGGRE